MPDQARCSVAARLIPLLALMAAGASQAQAPAIGVQIFGTLDVGASRRQLSGQPARSEVMSGAMTTSFFGLRGREDLGDGWLARFDLQSFLRIDDGGAGRAPTDPYWARTSSVGISGPYGSVDVGRVNTPMFLLGVRTNPFGSASGLGPFMMHIYLPTATQSMVTHKSGSDSMWNNSLSYVSPSMSGFSVQLMGTASEGASANGRRASLGLSYSAGALTAGVVHERLSRMAIGWGGPPPFTAARPAFTVEEGDSTFAAVSYQLPAVRLSAQVLDSRLRSARPDELSLTTTILGASVPIGLGEVLLSWGHTNKRQASLAGAVKRDTTSLVYDYRLSRRTDVYAGVLVDKVSALDSGRTLAAGVRHSF